jgi:hypothetical protein
MPIVNSFNVPVFYKIIFRYKFYFIWTSTLFLSKKHSGSGSGSGTGTGSGSGTSTGSWRTAACIRFAIRNRWLRLCS